MSRTDKTRPWWIKAAEHPVEVHDHRNGVCEIADVAPTAKQTFRWQPGTCHYDGAWWRPEFRCGCAMCGYGASRRGPRVMPERLTAPPAKRWFAGSSPADASTR